MYSRILAAGILSFFLCMAVDSYSQDSFSQEERDFIEQVTKSVSIFRLAIDKDILDINKPIGSQGETILMILIRKLLDRYQVFAYNVKRVRGFLYMLVGASFLLLSHALYFRNTAYLFPGAAGEGVTSIVLLAITSKGETYAYETCVQIDFLLAKPELDITIKNANNKTALDILLEGIISIESNKGGGINHNRLKDLQSTIEDVMALGQYPRVVS